MRRTREWFCWPRNVARRVNHTTACLGLRAQPDSDCMPSAARARCLRISIALVNMTRCHMKCASRVRCGNPISCARARAFERLCGRVGRRCRCREPCCFASDSRRRRMPRANPLNVSACAAARTLIHAPDLLGIPNQARRTCAASEEQTLPVQRPPIIARGACASIALLRARACTITCARSLCVCVCVSARA